MNLQNFGKTREKSDENSIIFDNTPISLIEIDQNGVALRCNKATIEMFDFSDKNQFLKSFTERSLSGEHIISLDNIEKAIQYETYVYEDTISFNNLAISVEITLVPINDRQTTSVLIYIEDMRFNKEIIKQKQALEKARLENEKKSRFLARISHEIRVPINTVLGISEIELNKKSLTVEQESAFANIQSNSRGLLGIVNDILDFSRIESGKVPILKEDYDIANMISEVLYVNVNYIGSKRIVFEIEIDPDLPSSLIGDELRIKQVFNNLLSNSFKYTEKGFVKFSIRKELIRPGQINLIATISDTGLGMNKDQIESHDDDDIFFGERKEGLGLNIVYSLLKIMEANIEITSEVGKGTTTVVTIPQDVGHENIIGDSVAKNIEKFEYNEFKLKRRMHFTPDPMPYGSVLIIDDVETNLYIARGLMMVYGLSIDIAKTGKEALVKIESGRTYDIIFMDYMMPDMDGIETTTRLRQIGYKNTIIALSAITKIRYSEEFLNTGFDGFITKPIDSIQLDNILNRFIRDKQPEEVINTAKQSIETNVTEKLGNYFKNDLQDKDFILNKKIRSGFHREQKNAFNLILEAIEKNEISTARRHVHTIKTTAGLIGEIKLQELSSEVEIKLKDKEYTESDFTQCLNRMMEELNIVLSGIEIQSSDIVEKSDYDKEKVKADLNELHKNLKANNISAIEIANKLKEVPETAVLVRQVEDFDFEDALKTLLVLKEVLDIE